MNTALHTAGLLQTKAYRILQGRVSLCLQAHGLNHGQWTMLGVVADANKGIRLNATAEILGVKAPLITAMANEMISAGYLDRISHQRDKRAKLLVIAPKGKKLLKTVHKSMAVVLQQLLDGLSPEDMETYRKVLSTIVSNSEKTS